MKASRVIALVIGCLLLLPGLGMLLGGSALTLAYAFGRDDGYLEVSLDRLQTPTVAITAEDIDLTADPGDPDWLLDALDIDVRLQLDPVGEDDELFVGVGAEADVAAYLDGVARDEIERIDGRAPEYRRIPGSDEIDAPTRQAFWTATATGVGPIELEWEAESGRWAVVVMNADGSPGFATDVDVGADAGFLLPLAIFLAILGLVLTGVGVTLIVVATVRHRSDGRLPPPPPPPPAAAGVVAADVVDEESVVAPEPVSLTAELDDDLSPWKWLVKWILAIPHFIVLAGLWIALFVTTVVAGFSILFTRRYPRGLFDFNVGVLRWTWRVHYYAGPGGLGTDSYPPFSLADDELYPARLNIEPPGELSRGLVLVKWWLLAIPQYLVVGVLIGGTAMNPDGDGVGISLLGLLVFIAAVILLFTGRYRPALFDLIIGLNRWVFRVAAYAVLMTDRYPPFRLDQGGAEPGPESPVEASISAS